MTWPPEPTPAPLVETGLVRRGERHDERLEVSLVLRRRSALT
jgi:hypothetical protein